MTTNEVDQFLTEIENQQHRDDRYLPDNRRRGQFQAGWKAASQRKYKKGEVWTWNYLGYRFGKRFGPVDEEEIKWVFGLVAGKYKPPGPA
jgi:hypothetical protein